MRIFATLALLSAASVSGAAAAQVLQARPQISANALPPGETRLANGAVAYRPKSAPHGPLPLVVLLHGAGGYPPRFLQMLYPEAERRGAVLLAPRSLGSTWDLVKNLAAGADPWRGADSRRIDGSLGDLFERQAIDRSRVVLLGFSDGASYALSLGLANPRLFTGVVALSPGMMTPAPCVDEAQRIFIAHGRSDRVLPFANAERIAENLSELHANLRFRPFDGEHQINRPALGEALDFALSLQALPPAPTSAPN